MRSNVRSDEAIWAIAKFFGRCSDPFLGFLLTLCGEDKAYCTPFSLLEYSFTTVNLVHPRICGKNNQQPLCMHPPNFKVMFSLCLKSNFITAFLE